MRAHKAPPQRLGGRQQRDGHRSARGRSLSAAGEHVATLQTLLQGGHTAGHEQGAAGRHHHEALQDDSRQGKGMPHLLHLHGQVQFKQAGPEEWHRPRSVVQRSSRHVNAFFPSRAVMIHAMPLLLFE